MLGLENAQTNSILWTAGVAVDSDEAALAIAKAGLTAMTAQVRELSSSIFETSRKYT